VAIEQLRRFLYLREVPGSTQRQAILTEGHSAFPQYFQQIPGLYLKSRAIPAAGGAAHAGKVLREVLDKEGNPVPPD